MDNSDSNSNAFEKWQALLQKELKTSDLEAKSKLLANGINYNPYTDPSNTTVVSTSPASIPSLAIGHRFVELDEIIVNRYLKLLVQYDLQVFSVQYSRAVDWNILLDGIYPEMLFMDVIGDEECINSFLAYKSGIENSHLWNSAIPAGNSTSDTIQSLNYTNFGTAEQVTVLRDLKKDLTKIEGGRIKICIQIDAHALNCLPFINAIHQIMANTNVDYILESVMNTATFDSSLESGLIEAGGMAVWASVAKVGHLYFNPIVSENQMDYARLVLNIQNLIALESKMNNEEYALKGAYAIEQLTKALLDKA